MNSECIEFEPPVSWFQTQLGPGVGEGDVDLLERHAHLVGDRIAIAVVMPWPTSARGSANDTVPSGLTATVIRCAVGLAASVSRSVRS